MLDDVAFYVPSFSLPRDNRGKFWFDQTEHGSKTLLHFFLYIFCKLQPVSGETAEVMDRESFLEGKTCTLHPEVHS